MGSQPGPIPAFTLVFTFIVGTSPGRWGPDMDPNGFHMNFPFTVNAHLAVGLQIWTCACFDVCFDLQWIHLLYLGMNYAYG